jgi:hypothetical protein
MRMWARIFVCCAFGMFSEMFFFTFVEIMEGNSNVKLETKTYLWMFPIWGFGLYFADQLFHNDSFPRWYHRYIPYVFYYILLEYSSGALLFFFIGECPWDYSSSGSDWHCHGFARLDYSLVAPLIMYCLVEPSMKYMNKFTIKEKMD